MYHVAMEPIENTTSKNWTTAIAFLSLLLIFLIVNLTMAAPFFLAVVMGGIMALLSFPLYRKLRARNWSQKLSAFVITLGVSIILLGPLISFCIVAVNQTVSLAQKISEEESLSIKNITGGLSQVDVFESMLGNGVVLEKEIKGMIQKGAKTASAAGLALVGSLPDRGLHLVLALLACFFLLIDGRRFIVWLNDKIPLDWDVRNRLYTSFEETTVSVIWATFAAAGAQAAIMFATFLILKVPGAFLAGGATFIFAWIPLLGSAPVWIAGAIYLFVQGKITALMVMVALGLFTGVVDNYIRPLVLKGKSDLHPLVSLVAIFGGIEMFGIFGVLIGPILAAALLSLLQIWPAVGRRFGLTFDPKVSLSTSPEQNR